MEQTTDITAKAPSPLRRRLSLQREMKRMAMASDIGGNVITLCKQGRLKEALNIFHVMVQQGIRPDSCIYASLLQECVNKKALREGKLVHAHMIDSGFCPDIFLETKLVIMYAKCGSLLDARRVLDEMPARNVVSWTAMIAGYARNGHVEEALELFRKMPERNVVSWTAMIAGYVQNGFVDDALKFFQKMPERNVVSWNAMITGYGQNEYVDEALKLFQIMPERNAVSWNAMIAGYAQNGCFEEALKLFRQMQQAGVRPDSVTFASVLSACSNLVALEHGKNVHEVIVRNGFDSNVFVGDALIDMYAKCGSIADARQVFDKMPERDVVSWNAIVAGYAQNGNVHEALKLFQDMPERNVVSWTAMVAGYGQAGHVDEALNLFQKMVERDVVSWNALATGYAQNGHFNETLKVFRQMQLTGVRRNSASYATVLPACANLAALEHGKKVHQDIIRTGFQSDIVVGDALVDMYAKCGSIEEARHVFDKMARRNVISWTAMIVGYAMNGYGKEALQLFQRMQQSGTKPNHVTFVGVLSACCHAGLVDDGRQYFGLMSREYHITPAVEHYSCMVDLLGRAGRLDEAQDFINKMPIKPNAAVWQPLLGACRIHANIELGERVAECLFELDPKNASHYVMLSNIYATAGRWDGVEKLRKLMKDRGVKKMPGCSWIEVNNKVYSFLVGDRSHPQIHEICAKLERLSGQMKEEGYVPDTNFVLHDVEDEQKEHVLYYHSEKLAIAFGLIHISPRTPIRIVKNLRVCGDCHSAIKFLSKLVAQQIVVRDANRFHHFKDGWCSCGDYW